LRAEERAAFIRILSHSDDEAIEKFAAPVNEIEVSVCHGIEGPGIDGDDLFQLASAGEIESDFMPQPGREAIAV
jgi:hypothetical protein